MSTNSFRWILVFCSIQVISTDDETQIPVVDLHINQASSPYVSYEKDLENSIWESRFTDEAVTNSEEYLKEAEESYLPHGFIVKRELGIESQFQHNEENAIAEKKVRNKRHLHRSQVFSRSNKTGESGPRSLTDAKEQSRPLLRSVGRVKGRSGSLSHKEENGLGTKKEMTQRRREENSGSKRKRPAMTRARNSPGSEEMYAGVVRKGLSGRTGMASYESTAMKGGLNSLESEEIYARIGRKDLSGGIGVASYESTAMKRGQHSLDSEEMDAGVGRRGLSGKTRAPSYVSTIMRKTRNLIDSEKMEVPAGMRELPAKTGLTSEGIAKLDTRIRARGRHRQGARKGSRRMKGQEARMAPSGNNGQGARMGAGGMNGEGARMAPSGINGQGARMGAAGLDGKAVIMRNADMNASTTRGMVGSRSNPLARTTSEKSVHLVDTSCPGECPLPDKTFLCPTDGKFPTFLDCGGYHLCINLTAYSFMCRQNERYNVQTLSCIPDDNLCQTFDCSFKDEVFVQHPLDGSLFVFCINENPEFMFICPVGTVFSGNTDIPCIFACDGLGSLSDPDDPFSYYECTNTFPRNKLELVRKTCPPGEIFCPTTAACITFGGLQLQQFEGKLICHLRGVKDKRNIIDEDEEIVFMSLSRSTF